MTGEPKSLDAALIIAQTANVMFYLGPRLKLSPRDEAGRLWAHQLQLTITDLVVEIQNTNRPISSGQQKLAAKRRSKEFWQHRVSKFLRYFERVLQNNSSRYLVGRRLTYVDLAIFHNIEGLRYAFPKDMKRSKRFRDWSRSMTRWRSGRGLRRTLRPIGPFHSTSGAFFRHYKELDA